MSTFLSKLRILTLGAANDLADKAIDLNSPSALRQYVRDLEDALNQMKSNAATEDGHGRTLNRELGDLQASLAKYTQQVQNLMAQNKQDDAKAPAAMVVTLRSQITAKGQAIDAQTKAVADLDASVKKVQAKHDVIAARLHELERLDADTKVKNQSEAAMKQASSLVSGGSGIDVDNIEQRIRSKNDEASAHFDRAMAEISDSSGDTQNASDVEQVLAEFAPKA